MSGPGPNKLPFNVYITRQDHANIRHEARSRKITKTAVVAELLEILSARIRRRDNKLPRPSPKYNALWFQKARTRTDKRK